MKYSVFGALALAATAACAEVTEIQSSNTFGVMKVTCSTQKAVICTPWVAAVTAGEIALKDLVMTAGLDEDDAIILYKDGAFKGWTLKNGAWQGTPIASVGGTVTAGDNEAIKRGAGFWFVKKNFSDPYDVYLYGQDTAAAAEATVAANAYTLVANPRTSPVALTTALAGVSAVAGDKVQVPNGNNPARVYTFKNSAWGKSVKKEIGNGQFALTWAAATAEATLPAGQGFWYISKGGQGTITW